MAINLTKAKPYAKAIFDLALRSKQMVIWQQLLASLASISIICEKEGIWDDPKIEFGKKIDFFSEAIVNFPVAINLIRLLAERKKLAILPDIAVYYQQLFFAHNKVLKIKMVSAYELDIRQKERLLAALEQRYRCEILLQYEVDAELIGGAVIFIADRVIDHSLKGALQNLKQELI